MVQTDTHLLHFRRFGASGLDLARICAVLCEALRDAAMCTLFIVLYAPHYTCSLLNTTYYTPCYVASPPVRRTSLQLLVYYAVYKATYSVTYSSTYYATYYAM